MMKDLITRFGEMVAAWANMRPGKKFFGLTVEGFQEKAKPYQNALQELALLGKRGGLKARGAADESFRRAVVLWNLACYRALASKDVESVIEVLAEALHLAPEFREDLRTGNLDGDLAPLLGNAIFDRWRADVLNGKR
jgi:hypothetical protein